MVDSGVEVEPGQQGAAGARLKRADARRSTAALLEAALKVFTVSGVDAPYRTIADAAGVGMGTIYRHFPQRSDLIVAVYRRELQACAAAATLSKSCAPGEALDRWMQRLVDFVVAKRGLAAALHSGDPAYEGLPALLERTLRPALQGLLDQAAGVGEIRSGVDAWDLLRATSGLCTPAPDVTPDHPQRMVALLVDGLRYRATADRG